MLGMLPLTFRAGVREGTGRKRGFINNAQGWLLSRELHTLHSATAATATSIATSEEWMILAERLQGRCLGEDLHEVLHR